ncbi:MAG: ABC transporter permease [Firmicutes bacterium]|nr:ABC transporter permease [Bacillota bacterium]
MAALGRRAGNGLILAKIPGVVWAFAAMIAFFGFEGRGFLSLYNFINIIKQGSILAIAATGMTLAILSAGIDLSAGSVMSLSGVILGLLLHSGWSIPAAILVALCVGLACGCVNGYLVAHLKIHHFIATYGMMGMAAGIPLALTEGSVIPGFSQAFRFLGEGAVGGLPLLVIIAAAVFAVFHFTLTRTRWGAHLYAVGGSDQVARYSGVSADRVRMSAYVLSSLLAAFAGVLAASRANSASPIAGSGYEFDSIAAVIIGGTPFTGGRGGVAGTMLGVAMITVLKNGLNIMGFAAPWQLAIIGTMITLAITFDVMVNQRRKDRV